jgi:hypothetical protein
MLDGAWWPRSRHAEVELTALVAELTVQAGRVFRIGLNRATWDSRPLRVVSGGHVVKIGWFGPADPHALSATGDFPHRLDLLVVPPAAATGPAEAAMRTASDPSSTARATTVLIAHGIDTTTGSGSPAVAAPAPAPRTAPLSVIGPAQHAVTNGHRPGALRVSGIAGVGS